MPSLDECQDKINKYSTASDWLRTTIKDLEQLSDNLARMKNIVESNYSVNGDSPEIATRIQNLKNRVNDLKNWNRDEILMHIENELEIGRQEYDDEETRIEEEEDW